jgi:hypothetical protein
VEKSIKSLLAHDKWRILIDGGTVMLQAMQEPIETSEKFNMYDWIREMFCQETSLEKNIFLKSSKYTCIYLSPEKYHCMSTSTIISIL